jgi:hypothetical protein
VRSARDIACTEGDCIIVGADVVHSERCDARTEAIQAAREEMRVACAKIARDEQFAWLALAKDERYPLPAWKKSKASMERRARTAEMIADNIMALPVKP